MNTYTFYQGRLAYTRTRRLGWLMWSSFLICALVALFLSFKLLGSYTHLVTLYLKWQDALVALLWYVSFLGLEGCILVMSFLKAVRVGHTQGVLSLVDDTHIAVRDLSSENLGSIFWMLNASFWCFGAVLVGLVPVILIGWTLHIPHVVLAICATGLAILLSLAGLAVSVVAASFIVIGCFGAVSLARKLGSIYTYQLNNQTTIRLDGTVLTVIYPDMPESMLDLNSLDVEDQRLLLSLLRERCITAGQLWTRELSHETEKIAQRAESRIVVV